MEYELTSPDFEAAAACGDDIRFGEVNDLEFGFFVNRSFLDFFYSFILRIYFVLKDFIIPVSTFRKWWYLG